MVTPRPARLLETPMEVSRRQVSEATHGLVGEVTRRMTKVRTKVTHQIIRVGHPAKETRRTSDVTHV
jgi:hypothetical protein